MVLLDDIRSTNLFSDRLLDQIGLSHLSISVSDLKGLADDLASKGVEFAGPLESWLNARGELTSFYVYDPDGILLQFDAGGGG